MDLFDLDIQMVRFFWGLIIFLVSTYTFFTALSVIREKKTVKDVVWKWLCPLLSLLLIIFSIRISFSAFIRL